MKLWIVYLIIIIIMIITGVGSYFIFNNILNKVPEDTKYYKILNLQQNSGIKFPVINSTTVSPGQTPLVIKANADSVFLEIGLDENVYSQTLEGYGFNGKLFAIKNSQNQYLIINSNKAIGWISGIPSDKTTLVWLQQQEDFSVVFRFVSFPNYVLGGATLNILSLEKIEKSQVENKTPNLITWYLEQQN